MSTETNTSPANAHEIDPLILDENAKLVFLTALTAVGTDHSRPLLTFLRLRFQTNPAHGTQLQVTATDSYACAQSATAFYSEDPAADSTEANPITTHTLLIDPRKTDLAKAVKTKGTHYLRIFPEAGSYNQGEIRINNTIFSTDDSGAASYPPESYPNVEGLFPTTQEAATTDTSPFYALAKTNLTKLAKLASLTPLPIVLTQAPGGPLKPITVTYNGLKDMSFQAIVMPVRL